MEQAGWTLGINLLNVEVVAEVERYLEPRLNRDAVQAVHSKRSSIRVPRTRQNSLRVCENTSTAVHYQRKHHHGVKTDIQCGPVQTVTVIINIINKKYLEVSINKYILVVVH